MNQLPNNPKIIFCITCKGRTQHLKETLPKNLQDNVLYPNSKFVLLDYSSPDDLREWVKSDMIEYVHTDRLTVYSYNDAEAFHMAHAKNMAHRCGILEGADILVNLDADNFTGPDFARWISEQYALYGKDLYLWAHMIPGLLPRGVNGRIVVTKDAFLNAGGYDEKFNTWSHDDKDFNIRLGLIGYHPEKIENKFLDAVRHNDKMRFKDYMHAKDRLLFYDVPEKCPVPQGSCVVNRGHIGCGIVYKNFCFDEPVCIEPVPTRIFGIGAHKTATTSLHHALEILGIDSAHWITAKWAKQIWSETRSNGYSRTLEKSYALCDLPIPQLYKELDLAYPGSKFILTYRNEEEWVNSVEKHWSFDGNPYRAQWDTDPFTHKIHKFIYGQKHFDREIFLERYRSHNKEVIEYFKSRPEDLLIMDMSHQDGWFELCRFLDKHIPNVPYPNIQSLAKPPAHRMAVRPMF